MNLQSVPKHLPTLFLVFTALLLVACGGIAQAGEASVEGQADLVNQLEARGATVELGEPIEQPFFSVQPEVLKVNGMDVQVYEYDTEEMRAGESGAISPDGSVGTTMITWVDDPHFWAAGRLIVLYVGSDQATVDLLTDILGDPINQPVQ